MPWWLIAALSANAAFHLRAAVLKVQDGADRIKSGGPCPSDPSRTATKHNTYSWDDGEGAFIVTVTTVFAPVLTVYHVVKWLLFPFGVKSKFAKEQQAERKRAEAERVAEELEARTRILSQRVIAWNPGEFITDTPKAADPAPHLPTLAWTAAAVNFEEAEAIIKKNAGQAWYTGLDDEDIEILEEMQ